MDQELFNTVAAYINASLEGQDVENPKIDFKRQWYKLNEEPGIYEFLKDTSAIANTVGLSGFIIVGFDEREKTFHPCTFKDSGINDNSKLPDIISRHVDRIYEVNHYDIQINGHKLSVLHIPPSLDKPHIIRGYKTFRDGKEKNIEQHRTFVKRSTTAVYANKNDFELMYYDRKNLVPEYKIITNIHYPLISYNLPFYQAGNNNQCGVIPFQVPLTFENNDRRPVAVTFIELILTEYPSPSPYEFLSLNTSVIYKITPIIIHPNEIVSTVVQFECYDLDGKIYADAKKYTDRIINGKRHLETNTIRLTLANNISVISELIKI